MRVDGCAKSTNGRVYLTGNNRQAGLKLYARAGYITLTDKDRIRCKRAIPGQKGSITAITAINPRPEQGMTVTVNQAAKP